MVALHVLSLPGPEPDSHVSNPSLCPQVKDTPTKINEEPSSHNVVFEMSKEALETMLEGLSQIRDQLAGLQ